jgi:NADH-quinone oxidoreductase subunit C
MPALSFEQIRERLAARFGDAVGPTVEAKDPFVVVRGDALLEVCRFLRDEPELRLDYLLDETAVDYPAENLIRMVYHLHSVPQKHGFKVKVECDRASPKVASLNSVWRAADWLEREILDLFGVEFEGHPDPRRLFMPEDWEGHPMRKDWKESGGYHGISNERANPLDQLLAQDKKVRAELLKNAPPAPPVEAKPAVEAKTPEAMPAAEMKAAAVAMTAAEVKAAASPAAEAQATPAAPVPETQAAVAPAAPEKS